MKILIGFELKKFWTQKLNYLIFGILIIFLIGFIYPKTYMDRTQWNYMSRSLTSSLESYTNLVPILNEELKIYPGNDALVSNISDNYVNIEAHTNMIEALETNDWNQYLTYKIKNDKTDLAALLAGRLWGPDRLELEEQIELNELLLSQNIKPIFTDTSMETVNFFILLLQSKLTLFLIIMVILISSSFISQDFEKETYKLLYTQPISKFNILLSKLLTAIVINVSWLVSVLGSCGIILGLLNGPGNLQYPTKLYESSELAFTTAGHYLAIGLFIFACLVLLCIFITFTFSTLCHHTVLTMICSTLTFSLPLLFTDLNVTKYYPFTFSEVGAILSGTSAIKDLDFNLSFTVFPISLLLFTISLTIIFKYRKLT